MEPTTTTAPAAWKIWTGTAAAMIFLVLGLPLLFSLPTPVSIAIAGIIAIILTAAYALIGRRQR